MGHILFVILQISVWKGELQKYNPLKHGCAKMEILAFMEMDKNVFSEWEGNIVCVHNRTN